MRACRFNPTALGYFRFGGVCSIRLIAAATKQLWCSSSVLKYRGALAARSSTSRDAQACDVPTPAFELDPD